MYTDGTKTFYLLRNKAEERIEVDTWQLMHVTDYKIKGILICLVSKYSVSYSYTGACRLQFSAVMHDSVNAAWQ